jgi:hypothetical protein
MNRVDVLAVMKADATAAADYRYQRTREVTAEEYMTRLSESAQARTAVAELIAAADEVAANLIQDGATSKANRNRLVAALVAAREAQP